MDNEQRQSLPDAIAGILRSFRFFPFQSIAQIIAIIILFPAFFASVFFYVAEPHDQIIKRGYSIPNSWEAGVMNHGEYFEWYSMAEHPYYFILSIGTLIAALLFLLYMQIRNKL